MSATRSRTIGSCDGMEDREQAPSVQERVHFLNHAWGFRGVTCQRRDFIVALVACDVFRALWLVSGFGRATRARRGCCAPRRSPEPRESGRHRIGVLGAGAGPPSHRCPTSGCAMPVDYRVSLWWGPASHAVAQSTSCLGGAWLVGVAPRPSGYEPGPGNPASPTAVRARAVLPAISSHGEPW
jgi:hypothetical protein